MGMEAIAVEAQKRLPAGRRALLRLTRDINESESALLQSREHDEIDSSANRGAASMLDGLANLEQDTTPVNSPVRLSWTMV